MSTIFGTWETKSVCVPYITDSDLWATYLLSLALFLMWKVGAVKSNCVIKDGVSMSISIVWYINLLMIINSQKLNLIMTISEIYIA